MANEITKITDQNGVDHPLVDVLGREASVDLMKDTTGWLGGNEVDVAKYNHISTNCVASAVGDVMTFTAPITATGQYAELSYYASQTSDILFDHNVKRKMMIIVTALTSNKAAIGVRNSESRFVKTLKFESTGTYILDLSDVAEDYYVGVYPRWEYNNAEASMTFKLMLLTAEQYALNPSYRPYHGSVEEEKADKTGVISALKDTVGWIGKNHFDNKQAVADRTQTTNRTITDTGVRVTNSEATAYGYVRYNLRLSANTDKTISSKITRNGGVCHIMIRGSADDTTYTTLLEKTYNTGDIEDTFNTGNNTYIRLYLYCSLAESVVGDITYDELMISDADVYKLSPAFEPFHESVEEMLTPKLLPTGADLNNYINEGDYFAGSEGYLHCPISNTAFRFKVMPFNAEASRCVQIIYANKPDPEVYMRTNFSGTWQSWYKFTGTVVS